MCTLEEMKNRSLSAESYCFFSLSKTTLFPSSHAKNVLLLYLKKTKQNKTQKKKETERLID